MKKLSYPRSGESRLSYIEEDSQRAQSNLTFTQLTGGGGGTAYKPPSMTYLPFFPIRVSHDTFTLKVKLQDITR